MALSYLGFSQSLTIVSPELTEPYEVSPGTVVTFQWDYFGEVPTIFTHTEEPVLPDFGTDPAWTVSSDYVDNGDGTYNFDVTINDELWVWAGFFQSFFNTYAYSEIYHFTIASGVVISPEDGIVCPDGSGQEVLTVDGTYNSYQWYLNDTAIEGATGESYTATEAGMYRLEVTSEGEQIFSNTIVLTNASIEMTGVYVQGESVLNANATVGFDTYQWMAGNTPGSLSPIANEVNENLEIILESDEEYYMVEGVLDGCAVTSEERVTSIANFATPEIQVSADTNSFGNVCEGTTVTLSVADNYETYTWYRDGFDAFQSNPSFSFSNFWQDGLFYAEVTPTDWPEIMLVSEETDASFFEVNSPVLTVIEQGPYCIGDEVNIILGDDGYTYTWYIHEEFDYTDEDLVEVSGTTLTLDFEQQIRVTVVAEFEGCSSSTTSLLNAAASSTPFINFVDFNEAYLCTDSISEIQVPSWASDGFSNWQWFELVDDEGVIIEGETDLIYGAEETGFYYVTADLDQCPGESVTSNTVELQSYLDRNLFIWADMNTICEGDTTNLNMPSNEWVDIQWFNATMQIGSGGYEAVYVPIINGSETEVQPVTEFNSYLVKARHVSCPTGLKIESDIIEIRPTLEPLILVSPEAGDQGYIGHPYDSVPNFVFCGGQPVELTLDQLDFESVEWYEQAYSGADDYDLGELVSTGGEALVIADGAHYYTAKVEQEGCVGYSLPVLIDTWVFAPITITSYGNSELCEEGDSTLLHLSFPGNYESFEWYLDGILVEGETNDSIWATEPGMYTLTGYRAECPDVGISSGIGPTVSFFNPTIEENETVIFALPQFGIYEYQWFLDGEPIEAPAGTPWLLVKAEMEDGVYTCIVSSIDGCEGETEPYIWNTTGIYEALKEAINIYPNPAQTEFRISGIELAEIERIRLLDVTGRVVNTLKSRQGRFDISSMKAGIYLVELSLDEDTVFTYRLVVD